jgi:hypothetical protein
MTAWIVVLLVSLSMPALMHWATLTIQTGLPPPDAVIAQTLPEKRSTAQLTEFLPERLGSPPRAENPGPAEESRRGGYLECSHSHFTPPPRLWPSSQDLAMLPVGRPFPEAPAR